MDGKCGKALEDALVAEFAAQFDLEFSAGVAHLTEPILGQSGGDGANKARLLMNCSVVSQAFCLYWTSAAPELPTPRVGLSASHAWIVLPFSGRALDLSNPGSVEEMTVPSGELAGNALFAVAHGAPRAAALAPAVAIEVLATQRALSDLAALLNGPCGRPFVADRFGTAVHALLDAATPRAGREPAGRAHSAAAVCLCSGATLWLKLAEVAAAPALTLCEPASPAAQDAAATMATLVAAARAACRCLQAVDAGARAAAEARAPAVLGAAGADALRPGLRLLFDSADGADQGGRPVALSRGASPRDVAPTPLAGLRLAAACALLAHSRSPRFTAPLRALAHLSASAVALASGDAEAAAWAAGARRARAAYASAAGADADAGARDGVFARNCRAGAGAGVAVPPRLRPALEAFRADALLCAALVVRQATAGPPTGAHVAAAGAAGAPLRARLHGRTLPAAHPLRALLVLRVLRSLVRSPSTEGGVAGACPDRLAGEVEGSGDAEFLARGAWLLRPALAACAAEGPLPLPPLSGPAPDTGRAEIAEAALALAELGADDALLLLGGAYQQQQHQQAGTACGGAAAEWHRGGMEAWDALGVAAHRCARAVASSPDVRGVAVPVFVCLTCGTAPGCLCAHCAQECHRAAGHDVSSVGSRVGVWCACGDGARFASACLLDAGPRGAAVAPSAAAVDAAPACGFRAHPPRYCLPGGRCKLGGRDRLEGEALERGVTVSWPAGSAALAWEQDGDAYLIRAPGGEGGGVLEMVQCGACLGWLHPCCAFATRADHEEWRWLRQGEPFSCPECGSAEGSAGSGAEPAATSQDGVAAPAATCGGAGGSEAPSPPGRRRQRSDSNEAMAATEEPPPPVRRTAQQQ